MPRGKSAKPKASANKEPKKKATKSSGKKMEKDENKVTASRKRKQKASQAQQDSSSAPVAKRQKPTTSQPTEDTDRAVFTIKEAPREDRKATKEEKKTDTISHPSHKQIPGQVMTFGQGDIGQLGLGEDVVERKKPSPVDGDLEGKKIIQVACGGMHTVALTDDGKVYTWGCNDESALGRYTEEGDEFSPGQVEALEGVMVVQVSAGDCHTAALTDTGVVYCWGVFRDSNGQFGLTKPGLPSPTPEVVYESQDKAVKVVSGNDHVVVLTSEGDIYTFGCAEQGQLGRVPECFSVRGGRKGVQHLLEPQVIRFRRARGISKPKFSDVFCGSYTTFACTDSSHVYVWGLNNYGQLGVDDVESRYQPELLPSDWLDSTEDIDSSHKGPDGLEIAGGQHHTLICHRGCVYVMGRREYGRLGLGENSAEEPLVPFRLPSLRNIVTIGTGSVCSFAVTRSGEVYSWGMGTSLQLGSGSEDDIWEPTPIIAKKIENRKIIAACAGGQHTALLVNLPYDS